MKDVGVYILAGGKSRRFLRDKRKLLIDGERMIDRVASTARVATGEAPTFVGSNLNYLRALDGKVIDDAVKGIGPLGGVMSALAYNAREWTLLLSVNQPALTPRHLTALLDNREERVDAVIYAIGKFDFTLPLLLRSRTITLWCSMAERGEFALGAGFGRMRVTRLEPIGGEDALVSINKASDLKRYLANRPE